MTLIFEGTAESGRVRRKALCGPIPYADPDSWAQLDAAVRAMRGRQYVGERVALLTIGGAGPVETRNTLVRLAARGISSPLRFPAALPSASVGLVAIGLGLRGPTLHLAGTVASLTAVATVLTRTWIRRDIVEAVLVVASTTNFRARSCVVDSEALGQITLSELLRVE